MSIIDTSATSNQCALASRSISGCNNPSQNHISGTHKTIQVGSEKEFKELLIELRDVAAHNETKVEIKFDEITKKEFSYFGLNHTITIYINNTKKLTLENIPKPFIENTRPIIDEIVSTLSDSLFQPQTLSLLKVDAKNAVVIKGGQDRQYLRPRHSTNFVSNKVKKLA